MVCCNKNDFIFFLKSFIFSKSFKSLDNLWYYAMYYNHSYVSCIQTCFSLILCSAEFSLYTYMALEVDLIF